VETDPDTPHQSEVVEFRLTYLPGNTNKKPQLNFDVMTGRTPDAKFTCTNLKPSQAREIAEWILANVPAPK